jgi:hypothetical protein
MAIDLQKKISTKIASSNKGNKTPKSVRLLQSEIILLEHFKERIESLTSINSCSNTQAFKVMLSLAKNATNSSIKKALSSVL